MPYLPRDSDYPPYKKLSFNLDIVYINIVTYFWQSAESGHIFYSEAKSRNFQLITITSGKGIDCSFISQTVCELTIGILGKNPFALVLLQMIQLSFCRTKISWLILQSYCTCECNVYLLLVFVHSLGCTFTKFCKMDPLDHSTNLFRLNSNSMETRSVVQLWLPLWPLCHHEVLHTPRQQSCPMIRKHFVRIEVRAKRNSYRAWIAMKKWLVAWAAGHIHHDRYQYLNLRRE